MTAPVRIHSQRQRQRQVHRCNCPKCGVFGEHRHPDAPTGSRRRRCACGHIFVVCSCGNPASQHDDECDLCGQPLQ